MKTELDFVDASEKTLKALRKRFMVTLKVVKNIGPAGGAAVVEVRGPEAAVRALAKHTGHEDSLERARRKKAIVAGALKFAEEKRAQGWTRQDAAASLKRMLESATGDEE